MLSWLSIVYNERDEMGGVDWLKKIRWKPYRGQQEVTNLESYWHDQFLSRHTILQGVIVILWWYLMNQLTLHYLQLQWLFEYDWSLISLFLCTFYFILYFISFNLMCENDWRENRESCDFTVSAWFIFTYCFNFLI